MRQRREQRIFTEKKDVVMDMGEMRREATHNSLGCGGKLHHDS